MYALKYEGFATTSNSPFTDFHISSNLVSFTIWTFYSSSYPQSTVIYPREIYCFHLKHCVRILTIMPKRTWQPKVKKGNRKHGFLKRMLTKAGRNVLKRRRAKGRTRLAINRGWVA